MAWQLAKREAGKASPTSAVLLLPVVPHVGETDTDTLTEIPGRPAEAEEEEEVVEEEVEDEFGYSWSEFMFLYSYRAQLYILLEAMVKYLFKASTSWKLDICFFWCFWHLFQKLVWIIFWWLYAEAFHLRINNHIQIITDLNDNTQPSSASFLLLLFKNGI